MKKINTAEDIEGRNIPAIFPGTMSKVTVTSTSAQSVALGASTGLVRIAVSTDCFVAFGANPTAVATDMFMPAGLVEYFAVDPGTKVAFLRSTADGFASITEAL